MIRKKIRDSREHGQHACAEPHEPSGDVSAGPTISTMIVSVPQAHPG